MLGPGPLYHPGHHAGLGLWPGARPPARLLGSRCLPPPPEGRPPCSLHPRLLPRLLPRRPRSARLRQRTHIALVVGSPESLLTASGSRGDRVVAPRVVGCSATARLCEARWAALHLQLRLCRRRPEAPAGVARAGMLQSRTLRCHFLHFCIMFTGHGTVFISYKPLKMGKTAGPREAGVRGGCAPAPCGGPVRPGCGRLLPSGVMGCDPCSQSTGGSSEGAAGLRVTTCGRDPRQGAVCWCCTCVLCHWPSRGDQEGPSEEAALDRSLWGLGVLLPPRPVLWPAPGPHSASSSGVGRGHSGGRQSG